MSETWSPKFVIPASEALTMASSSSSSLESLLPSLVSTAAAKSLARAPISNFAVAAAGLGSSTGKIFIGVNVEFPKVPLHHSIHAEQFLIANLSLHNEPSFLRLAVSAAPCGHCRQFLQELRFAPQTLISIANDHSDSVSPLGSLLPRRFGPSDLLPHASPFLLEPRRNNLALNEASEAPPLAVAALEAAEASHAPYSKCPSGVALRDRSGSVFKGGYMESAAFNPSLGPLQVALVGFIVNNGGGFEDIVEAVLVEVEGAVVAQEETVRMLLRAISPACRFSAFPCNKVAGK